MEGQTKKPQYNFSLPLMIGIILLSLLVPRLISGMTSPPKVIPYSEFKTALAEGQVLSVTVSATGINSASG
jgi:hypothetical protein